MPSYTVTYEHADQRAATHRRHRGDRTTQNCSRTTVEADSLHSASYAIANDLPDVRIVSIEEVVSIAHIEDNALLETLDQKARELGITTSAPDLQDDESIRALGPDAISVLDAISIAVETLAEPECIPNLEHTVTHDDARDPLITLEVYDRSSDECRSKSLSSPELFDPTQPDLAAALLDTARTIIRIADRLI